MGPGEKKKELVINEDGTDTPDKSTYARETWDNPWEFFLSCLGYAVGFGNVWRFPYLCFKNGGAVFLIPYTIMLFVAGVPMFFLELAIGQYASLGPNVVFPQISPLFSGLGYSMMVTTGLTSIYYNMLLAWSLFYTFASFTSDLPWSSCNNTFNSENCFTNEEELACKSTNSFYYNHSCHTIQEFCSIADMQMHNETHCSTGAKQENVTAAAQAVNRITSSEDYFQNRMLGVGDSTWGDLGSLRWEIVGCYALAWIIVCACMIKGVKSSGKVVYVTATFPYVVLLILLIRGLTLEGAYQGIEFYILKPNITKLGEVEVWTDAAGQIFFSLSVGFGGLITLASYNKFHNNCLRDALMITICNCATSVFAGFVIFSILGFLAHELGVDVPNVADSGSGLAFIAYPAAVSRMPIPPLWSILFFLMLISLGIDSQFAFVETMATGLFDLKPSLRPKKPLVMIAICTFFFLLGLILCLEGGVLMFELLSYYSGSLSVLFIAICEIGAVVYCYGFNRFLGLVSNEMKIRIPTFLRHYFGITWVLLTPISLILILVLSSIDFSPASWGSIEYPYNIHVLGTLTIWVSVLCVPCFTIYVLYDGISSKKKMCEILSPKEEFCPASVRRENQAKEQTNGRFAYVHHNEAFVGEETNKGRPGNLVY